MVVTVPATPTARSGLASGSRPRTCARTAATSSPEPLGQAYAADVEADAQSVPTTLELRRAAADVDHQRPRLDARRFRPQRHLRLLVAAQEPRREAVAPLDLAEEGLAVLGVPDRARRDAECALGAEGLSSRR